MWLLAVYVVFVLIGDLVAYGVGEFIDRSYPTISLPVFLAMFFAVLWLAWRAAILATPQR